MGWTLGDEEGVWGGPIVVLCPALFARNAFDKLNLEEQKIGTVLNKMETKSLTWYHEMFHLVFPDSMDCSP